MPQERIPGGSTPAYVAIAASLRARIEHEPLAAHSALPSERDLAEKYGVSRMTARHAVNVLESEGVVYRSPPRGTFVAEPRIPLRMGSLSEQIALAGRSSSATVVWTDTLVADRWHADGLDIEVGDPVHALLRVRLMDGVPLALETSYFPASLTPGLLDREDLDGSLWNILREEHGLDLARASAQLEVVSIGGPEAKRLGVREATSGILLTRRTLDSTGRCIEYALDTYRADRASFALEAEIVVPDERFPSPDRQAVDPATPA